MRFLAYSEYVIRRQSANNSLIISKLNKILPYRRDFAERRDPWIVSIMGGRR